LEAFYAEFLYSVAWFSQIFQMNYRPIEVFSPGTVFLMQAKWISSATDLRYVGSGLSISETPTYTAPKRFGFAMT
jgi:hypothetical protein